MTAGNLACKAWEVSSVSWSKTQVALYALPFLIMAAVTAVALAVARGASILPLLSLGPAFAAVTGRVRFMLAISSVAIALCALEAAYENAPQRAVLAFATIAGVTVAGIIASAGRRHREREFAKMTAIAEATQRVLLRPVPGQIGPAHLAVRYMSATSGARIGGDLYEAVPVGRGLRLIVGDVEGKGLPAVQTAATVLGAFRECAYDAASLAVIANRIEASLARQTVTEQFVTAVIAEVNADGSAIELLNCGHPAPLLLTGGTHRYLEPREAGLPLGLAEFGHIRGEPLRVPVRPGDAVLFYTDGITEARDRSGEFFPLHDKRALAAACDTDPGRALDRLSEQVVRHVGHTLDDDAAMLLVRLEGAPVPAQPAPAGPAAAKPPAASTAVPVPPSLTSATPGPD